jgi:mersacidin/lichenicidin family type 2 lantibiotic
MTAKEIVRAWKDEDYRAGLGEAELALLPENPAGIAVVEDRSDPGASWTLTCTKLECSNYISCTHHCW